VRAVPRDPGDVDEGAEEGDVEDAGDEDEEAQSAEEVQHEEVDERVEDAGARDAFDGADVLGDWHGVVVQRGEIVTVDAEDDAGAAELDSAQEVLHDLEGEANFASHVGGCAREELLIGFEMTG